MRRPRRAFTLVEILIVVLILGILATIALPQFWEAPGEARQSALLENIAKIRLVIEVYRNEHAGLPHSQHIADQLTKPTTFAGEVGEARGGAYRYGPYLEAMPANPFTGLRTVRGTDDPSQMFPPGDLDGGWWYNQANGRFYCDLRDIHVDGHGKPYNHY
jgi:general secretion pathway protein G